ncbi:MAG TPA: fatty acid desaturase, partial [Planctomycetaceae bacterium]|nr:fatty acid desaturase [Planctomycetaceae bacterium]
LWTFSGAWPAIMWKHAHVTVHHAHVLEDCDWTVPHRRADGKFESHWIYCLFHWPYRYYWHFLQDLRTGRGGDRFRREFPKELTIHLALWSIPFWIDPVMAIWLWVVPQVWANITMGSGMYVQHVGCVVPTADHPYRHSNDCLSKFFNLTHFNIGYHIEHHSFAHIHWCDLPALHEALQAHLKADDACEVNMGYFHAGDLIGRAGVDWSKNFQDRRETEPALATPE